VHPLIEVDDDEVVQLVAVPRTEEEVGKGGCFFGSGIA